MSLESGYRWIKHSIGNTNMMPMRLIVSSYNYRKRCSNFSTLLRIFDHFFEHM